MTTVAIPDQKFQSLLEAEPDFAHGLLLKLCSRLREAEERS